MRYPKPGNFRNQDCPTCGGSGGGPSPFCCPSCNGTGQSINWDAYEEACDRYSDYADQEMWEKLNDK